LIIASILKFKAHKWNPQQLLTRDGIFPFWGFLVRAEVRLLVIRR
jgi:hypothetical protein